MRLPRPSTSQFGTGAVIVAALAVGQLLNDHLPDGSDGSRLFEKPVAIGQTVELRTGDLTPLSVDGAKAVLRDVGSSFRSPGVTVVVKFDFVSRNEATSLTYAELRDGAGRVTTVLSSGQRSDIACPGSTPGIVVHCSTVVEADPDSLAGATLGIAVDSFDPRFDDMAVIDLDISAADVRGWQAQDELELVTTSVEGMS